MNNWDIYIYTHNGILLSNEKEQNWVIYKDVDGPRNCHTEWSKSERKIIILMDMCDLKKLVQMILFTKQKRIYKYREQAYGTKEGWEVGWIGRLGLTYVRCWYYV